MRVWGRVVGLQKVLSLQLFTLKVLAICWRQMEQLHRIRRIYEFWNGPHRAVPLVWLARSLR